jgi:hypothetical protein
MDFQKEKKKLLAQLVLKSCVAQDALNKDSLIELLNTTSSSNSNIQFEQKMRPVMDEFKGEEALSYSFQLKYPISNEQLRILSYMKGATGFETKAGSDVSFEVDKMGQAFAVVNGPDNFAEKIMAGRPLHANMVDLEKYAKMDASREFVRQIATSGIYQVNPEAKYTPASTIGAFEDYKDAIKNDIDSLVLDSTYLYIPYDSDIDEALQQDIVSNERSNTNQLGLGYLQMKSEHFPQSIGGVVESFNNLIKLNPSLQQKHPEPLTVPESEFAPLKEPASERRFSWR